ncbi:MAG: nucleotide exchange factor GrpE, partial [Pseudomonadota bacterium]|nr:nucleotide exchange factor GrpE [Pseudomonadota bacterium]
QAMTLRRLDRILADYRVQPLEVLDRPLDPHAMRVVEVESRADRAQGVVTAELRKGFFWEDDLLRPAEVKVNKRDQNP